MSKEPEHTSEGLINYIKRTMNDPPSDYTPAWLGVSEEWLNEQFDIVFKFSKGPKIGRILIDGVWFHFDTSKDPSLWEVEWEEEDDAPTHTEKIDNRDDQS